METSDKTFEKDIIEKSKEVPVLIDFHADWCGPCQILKPILEKLAKEYGEKLVLVKCDIEKCQESASRFGVMSVPSVKLIKNGEVTAEFVGAKSEEDIKQWIDSNL